MKIKLNKNMIYTFFKFIISLFIIYMIKLMYEIFNDNDNKYTLNIISRK